MLKILTITEYINQTFHVAEKIFDFVNFFNSNFTNICSNIITIIIGIIIVFGVMIFIMNVADLLNKSELTPVIDPRLEPLLKPPKQHNIEARYHSVRAGSYYYTTLYNGLLPNDPMLLSRYLTYNTRIVPASRVRPRQRGVAVDNSTLHNTSFTEIPEVLYGGRLGKWLPVPSNMNGIEITSGGIPVRIIDNKMFIYRTQGINLAGRRT